MIADLHALKNAPVIEATTAPAILSGRASGVFFHEVFGHRVEAPGTARRTRAKDRLSRRRSAKSSSLPRFPSTSTPRSGEIGNVELAGYYEVRRRGG